MALVLSPEPMIADWLTALDAQIARSSAFFAGKPVILDLGLLAADDEGLDGLVPALTERGIRLIAIEGGSPDWEATRGWDWPDALTGGRAVGALDIPEEEAPAPPAAPGSLILDEPVRSGQSIVYPEGDIIVMGSVASGAEVVAGGSIHVYGALRGRAVAGLSGRPESRILCRRMEAELIAIDGYYLTAEDIPAALTGQPAQARLHDENVLVTRLD
ncbi:septum site-determining protein MinC [Endobacter medicaginis]|uniref:Probable septum site-determining protein MinC n=4 Tax=Endobacter medicaginis TaxID=1181271 RepID=A0A839UVF8_9PROT|nr:septum site-determining protein MinC [Endobacter medicaginis]MBB3174288.1 septum site-determining protein MinC [Endobacter medicaginis]MCX5476171.1 septum site-determining protein MinC [Endobacter medicaginis]